MIRAPADTLNMNKEGERMDACGLWGKREAESRDSGDVSEAFLEN